MKEKSSHTHAAKTDKRRDKQEVNTEIMVIFNTKFISQKHNGIRTMHVFVPIQIEINCHTWQNVLEMLERVCV